WVVPGPHNNNASPRDNREDQVEIIHSANPKNVGVENAGQEKISFKTTTRMSSVVILNSFIL
ncbi:MAG: hypothetical protein C0490_24210, partial [Marivirga sp.]|nr:hypothetical protein [Marivirga sp.]